MPATVSHYRLDPCPADERVSEYNEDDLPEGYEARQRRSTESTAYSDDGIIYQKCGGGRRVVRKKISN